MSEIQNLNKFREQIDIIDDKLFDLLIARANVSAEVGNVKKNIQKEIFNRGRESVIFEKLQKKCREQNIDFEYIENIWNTILNKSHEIQIHGKY
jgi:chorismate mutase